MMRSAMLKTSNYYPYYLKSKIIITIVFSILLLTLFVGSNQANAVSVNLDQPSVVINHSGIITVIDPGVTSVTVTVASTSPAGSIDLILPQDSSGNFIGTVDFIPAGAIQDGINDLRVDGTATINVSYSGSDGPHTDSAEVELTGTNTFGTRQTYTNKPTCTDNEMRNGVVTGDGLCDSWEQNPGGLTIVWTGGSPMVAGTPAYVWPCDPCPSSSVFDLYVEIDYMEGHYPDQTAIQKVKDAFLAKGIQLHVQVDEMVLYHTSTTPFPGTSTNPGFDQEKDLKFGTAWERDHIVPIGTEDPTWGTTDFYRKKAAVHYVMFVHDQMGFVGTSGVGEVWGNDAMISLGAFAGQVGSTDQQAGTLMHELGHNLRLHHGGLYTDQINCKPNYISVMNYNRQMPNFISNRELTFSSKAFPSINENSPLNEGTDVGPYLPEHPEESIVYGLSTSPTTPSPPWYDTTGQNVDWNRDGDGGTDNEMVTADTNNLAGCNGAGLSATSFSGYNDWANLNYKIRDSGTNYADGVTMAEPISDAEVAGGVIADYQISYTGTEYTKRIDIDQRLMRVAQLEVAVAGSDKECKDLVNHLEILTANDKLTRAIEVLEYWMEGTMC